MTTINLDKIYSKFSDIKESLDRLREFEKISLEDFLGDRDKQDIAGFRLIIVTEAAIDICLHVTAKKLKKVPEEYASCFKLLADHGLIDAHLATRLVKMARFRNLLVHQYWDIDYSRIYELITGSDLDDLEDFVRQIKKVVDEKSNTQLSFYH